jgi:hypothetical protein
MDRASRNGEAAMKMNAPTNRVASLVTVAPRR